MAHNVHVGLLVRLEAKPGKEAALQAFLEGALPLANEESLTAVWFALKIGPSTFGIFDALPDDEGRAAHIAGAIADALRAQVRPLAARPVVEPVDVLVAKLP
jgi:quinol monooxygenase YgiN